ncbi:hypothetical protein MKW98_020611 [Papaver atlanticum]|uniref:PAZ domain-containing protein n=1 Tax=Papaver atlanticum TaxID=357466 RepID=A0AAD4XXE0_9MAGN|nr:hypothetical protein MKW98_020611 [Papaver atlanticum]
MDKGSFEGKTDHPRHGSLLDFFQGRELLVCFFDEADKDQKKNNHVEKGDVMKYLQNRILDSKREMLSELKNLRVKVTPSNSEYKITGPSEFPCRQQMFTMNPKGADADGRTVEITVYNYFVNHHHTEICSLVSLQRYTKALSTIQRSLLVEKLRKKPQEQVRALSDVSEFNNYDNDPMLKSCVVYN